MNLWAAGMLLCGLITFLNVHLQRQRFETHLSQLAMALGESLYESSPELQQFGHGRLSEEGRKFLREKTGLFEAYLRRSFPEVSIYMLHDCGEESPRILHSENAKAPDRSMLSEWQRSIEQEAHGVHRLNNPNSVLFPLYSMDPMCKSMVISFHFGEGSMSPSGTRKTLQTGLLFAAAFSGICLLMVLLFRALGPKNPGENAFGASAFAMTLFAGGLLLSLYLAMVMKEMERAARLSNFETVAASVTSRMSEKMINLQQHTLTYTAAYLGSLEEVTEEAFRQYTRKFQHPDDRIVLYWISAEDDAPPRIRYCSVELPASLPAGDPENYREILNRAVEIRGPASSRIHTSELLPYPGIFAGMPVFRNEHLAGWVGCSLSLKDLLNPGWRYGNLNPDTLAFSMFEIPEPFQMVANRIPPHAYIRPVFSLGRSYILVAAPSSRYWQTNAIHLDLWVWGAGSLLFCLLGIVVYQNLLRHQLLEQKITERTRSLNRLLDKHQSIIDNLPLGLALCENGDLVEMNPKLKTWFSTHEDMCRQLKPLIQDSLNRGDRFKETVSLETRAGMRQMECTALHIGGENGDRLSLILLEDHTERLHFERELKEKTLELQRLFNSSSDLLCTSALDGSLLNLNPQWERTLGYTVSEMNGEKWTRYVSAPDQSRAEKLLRRLHDGEAKLSFTLRFEHHSGDEIWLEWKVTRKRELLHANVRDITARVEAEDKNRSMREHVARSQKMESIGRLAGGIAHDFNNSLQVIIGNTQLVMGGEQLTSAQRAQLEDVLKAADRSTRLTRQLLGFAMKQHVHADPIDLNRKLQEMEPMFTAITGDLIQINWELDPDLAEVKMDSGQLDQIFVSLLENARDAMPKGGSILLKTENRRRTPDRPPDLEIDLKPGNYVCFSVTDTGSGIDRELKGTLFEPFTTTQDPSRGSGLGLATVYGILQQNKGSIRVESETGRGTKMEIWLPRLDAAPQGEPQAGSALREDGRILVVDDNPQVLQLAGLILQQLAYEVLLCKTAAEALVELQKDQEISLLLTDVLMPETTGLELYEQAVALRPDLKCIFMSGYSSDIVEDSVLEEGKNKFLLKPFTVDGLQAAVEELLLSAR